MGIGDCICCPPSTWPENEIKWHRDCLQYAPPHVLTLWPLPPSLGVKATLGPQSIALLRTPSFRYAATSEVLCMHVA